MRIRPSVVLTGLLCLAVVTGCTTISQGDPRPASSTETGPTTSLPSTGGDGEEELPFAGAPKVDNPLDTTRYEQEPCQALIAEQAEALNLPATGEIMDNVALGNACEWNNKTTRGYVQIYFGVDDPRGLSPEYEVNERGGWKYFKELPDIEGYPAVIRLGADNRDTGLCLVVVGVADDMSFESIAQLSQVNVGVKDPCVAAAEVAKLALETMKNG